MHDTFDSRTRLCKLEKQKTANLPERLDSEQQQQYVSMYVCSPDLDELAELKVGTCLVVVARYN